MSTSTMISQEEVLGARSGYPALKILLAEHDRHLRLLASIALRLDGHDVEEVADGSEMLEIMAGTIMDRDKRPFDLMITANELPGVPGFTVLAGLRARHWETPFILMTSDLEIQAQARRLGAASLGRPSNIKAIRSAIGEACALGGAKVGDSAESIAGVPTLANRR
jgi:two-component system cell cycle response regulator CpdR